MKYLYLILLAFACHTTNAQHLQRKGSLGVSYYQNVPDTLAKRLNYIKGAIIKQAIAGTTAQAIGLKPNDIVTHINAIAIEVPQQIALIAKNLRENQAIEITMIRDGKPLTLKGNVIGRPKETSPTADVVYGDFAYKGGYVRTIYKTLKNKKPIGTIYFLQGLPCYSMDNFQETDITKRAIDAMVERGFAVYRIEKGDMGDNINMPPCEQMGFDDEMEMYDAGYKNLLSLKNVDASSLFLFGHSMGGITAPLLAEKYQPRGVVVYGTGFKPWQEYLFDAFLIQSQYYGEDLGELRNILEKFKPHIYDYFYNNKSVEEIVKDPIGLMAFQQVMGYDARTGLVASGRHPKTFKEMNSKKLVEAWGNYENDVLAMYGEADIAAVHPDDHIALIEYINKKHPKKGTFWLVPKTTHNFEEIGSMEEFIKWQEKPQEFSVYATNHFNYKIFDFTCDWMKEILKKEYTKKVAPLFKDASDNLPDIGARGASMDVKAIDIDKDGDLDIILANEFQPNTILINDGKGNFTNESEKRIPQPVHDSEDIAVADFNGDGLMDIVFCSEDDKVHEYYLNTGNGHFKESPFRLPDSEANAVLAADLNGDKKPDLIFGNNGKNTILINKGNGDFSVETNRLPDINRVTQDLALVDIDKDGDLDLFAANEDGNVLYLNTGKGYFKDVTLTHLPAGIDMETRKVSFADVDKDGDMDLFLSNVNFRGTKNPQNRLYINNGKGKFSDETSKRLPEDSDHTADAIFEDLNNDGYPDLIIGNVFGGYVKIYLNNKGTFYDATQTILGKQYKRDALAIICSDFNGDGLKDIYIADRNNPLINKKDILLIREKK
ncbi:FG-GAP-like repeat-containing protein [Flavobacterium microcysteis]